MRQRRNPLSSFVAVDGIGTYRNSVKDKKYAFWNMPNKSCFSLQKVCISCFGIFQKNVDFLEQIAEGCG